MRKPKHYTRWFAGRPALDADALPAVIQIQPSRLGFVVTMLVAAAWSWFAIGFAQPFIARGSLFGYLFASSGAMFAVPALLQLRRAQRFEFDRHTVTARERGWLGVRSWWADYRDFEGVALFSHVRNGENSRTVYNVIALAHRDPRQWAPLLVRTGATPPRKEWEAYARAFRLPAIEFTQGGVRTLNVDELDQSFRDRARRRPASLDYDPAEPAPRGIEVQAPNDREILVTLSAMRLPAWALVIFLLPVPGMLALGVFGDGATWAAFGFAAFWTLAMGKVIHEDRSNPRVLALTRDRLALTDNAQWSRGGLKDVAIDEIEDVRIARAPSNMGNEVHLVTDRGAMSFGLGLNARALAWLRDYIAAAIAHA